MKVLPIYGNREINLSLRKYLIDWDKKERSKIQFTVKKFLEPYWKSHLVCSELRVPRTRMTLDIFNASLKIAIEIQGRQHTEFVPFFTNGSRSNFLSQIKRDNDKRIFCDKNRWELWEIFEEEIPNLSKEFFKEKFNFEL